MDPLDEMRRRHRTDQLDALIADSSVFERLVAAAPIRQDVPPGVALCVLAMLQLALRHPRATGESAAIARDAAEQLGAALVDRVPELAPLIAAGWLRRGER